MKSLLNYFFPFFLTKCCGFVLSYCVIYAVLSFVTIWNGMAYGNKSLKQNFPKGMNKVTTTTTICKNRLLIFF